MTSEKNNSLYNNIAVGAVAGFIGQYIGDFIYNILEGEGYSVEIRSSDSSYIAGAISGGVVAVFNNKLSTFQNVVISVGLFYVIFDATDQILGGDGMKNKFFLREFLTDVVIIYILVNLQNTFVELFFNNTNEEERLFDDEVVVTLITGIIINTYYDFKKLINKKKRN